MITRNMNFNFICFVVIILHMFYFTKYMRKKKEKKHPRTEHNIFGYEMNL